MVPVGPSERCPARHDLPRVPTLVSYGAESPLLSTSSSTTFSDPHGILQRVEQCVLGLKCRQPGVNEGVHLRTCDGCKAVSYCGRACQTTDWKLWHRAECRSSNRPVASIDGLPLAGDRCSVVGATRRVGVSKITSMILANNLRGYYDGWTLVVMCGVPQSGAAAWVPYIPAGLIRVSRHKHLTRTTTGNATPRIGT